MGDKSIKKNEQKKKKKAVDGASLSISSVPREIMPEPQLIKKKKKDK